MRSMNRADPAVRWLLSSKDPSVRYFTLTEILNEPLDSPEVKKARRQIPRGPRVRPLLSGQRADGSFGVHPYKKWFGAHWRLVSMVELGIGVGYKPALAAAETLLPWLHSAEHRRDIRQVDGRWRRHASMEGNALAVCSRLGLAADPRVAELARRLIEWQWPDGGWNCDPRSGVTHSSFHESLATLWGLTEYHKATGVREAERAARRAAELFLRHRLFRSERGGEVINRRWLSPHYPPYWHYDILQALLVLARFEVVRDPRTREALDILESRRNPDGCWHFGPRYWRLPREEGNKPVEVVDWGRRGPNEMITLNALRVLVAAGRVS